MNDTGLPSPFIDIMMFRPASRTLAMSAWNAGSVACTTWLVNPRSAISASSSASFAQQRRVFVAVEFDDQHANPVRRSTWRSIVAR